MRQEQRRAIAGITFVARVPGYSCGRCGAHFLEGRVLEGLDLEMACVLALRAPPSGDALRFLRKALGLRGLGLAALLQVTAETLSRWERGQRGVDANAWVTVGSLVLEKAGRPTATLERLSRLARRPRISRPIYIDVSRPRPRVDVKLTRASGLVSTVRAARAVPQVLRYSLRSR